ncbi:hypothetical protein KM622_gp023 [Spodoptera exempta nucleopolyhedrovirus]|uniref:Uncharacterized protein n=1 Tax=Spodoptera exempta nucleopolyhedrovirus TaxID=1242863 RepID=A0A410S7N7_9ABAC|nr:hypothetical protein KM622_gp023 [Spodoptera exempta nucleopolyhedrovirus]QAT90309.1 hypothetical protein [Spodoptera exempta nucleopolyhedrovirus]
MFDYQLYIKDKKIYPESATRVSGKLLVLVYNIENSNAVKFYIYNKNGCYTKHIQAAFQHDDRVMCIVNGRNRKHPIMFDGFIDERDESRTQSFVVGNLKELQENHGLSVRQMARAMESPTILNVYINEAIISNNLACKEEGAELDLLMKRLTINNNDNKFILPSKLDSKLNDTRWAPFYCKTGKHLFTIKIIFTTNCIR